MYCPSCRQDFSSTFSRCPECHCWLKPGGQDSDVSHGNQSEWLAGGESDGWGWNAPKEDSKSKSSHGLVQLEDHFGWDQVANKKSSDPDEDVDDAWIDESFEADYEDYEYERSSSNKPTVHMQLAEPANTLGFRAILVALAIFAAVGTLVTLEKRRTNQPDPTLSARREAAESAEIWLASARESAGSGNYKDAVLQYDKALQFLSQAEADRVESITARVEYADTLLQTGNMLAAHEQLFSVASEIEDGQQRLAAVEREIRKDANLQLEQAIGLLGTDPRRSARIAENVIEIYVSFDGSNSQIARAYDIAARAYLNQKEVTAAAEMVKHALRWQSSPERLDLYARLFPSAPLPEARPQRVQKVVVQASLGETNEVPKGVRNGPRPGGGRSQPVVVVETPRPKPPEHKPNYEKFKQKTQERLGLNPLTDTPRP